ncbi:MAG: hypothetical protein HYV09_34380 [Deltaproteobacteria bacterium]|nr:hypothetical protein [Deltaproteobacteria bacterium]
MSRGRWVIVCLSLLGAVACSSEDANVAATDAGVDARRDTGRPPYDASANQPLTCEGACSTELSGEPVPAGWNCIKTLDVQVNGLDEKPIEGITIMACSPTRCVHTDTDAAGKVHLVQCHWLTQPSFRLFGFDQFVQFAVPLRNPETSFTFTGVPVTRLPLAGLPIEIGKAQTLTQNGVTLELAAGATNAKIDEFAPYQDYRAIEVPKWLPELDQGKGLELIFSIGPQNTVLEPPAKLTLPNSKGWPAGTEVELFIHNFDQAKGLPVEIGQWFPGSGAKVSDDGKTIVGQIGWLSLVGVRRKAL